MVKKSKKESRSLEVLMGLVALYIQEGKPIGSHTLHEHGFEKLSSATIRNYFAELEKQGYLIQPHASGGRIPTDGAFRLYASTSYKHPILSREHSRSLDSLGEKETRNIATYLQNAAELLSETTGYPVFLSSARFDHDFIQKCKFLSLDNNRVLCVIITDFGQVLTEILPSESKISSFALKRIEHYFQWRLKGGEKPESLTEEESVLADAFYGEVMVRYLVRYSNFSSEDIHRTGFSKLLAYSEFNDPIALSTGLSLFENPQHMRFFLNECATTKSLRYWVGSDLGPYASPKASCAIIAVPYRVHQISVGSIALLGPSRIPYPTLFGALQYFSDLVSATLTRSLYKYKLSYRQPKVGPPYLEREENKLLEKKE